MPSGIYQRTKIVSAETRKKLSDINKGKHHSEETKRKISSANLGRKLTKEHKLKIGKGNKGKVGWTKGKRGKETPRYGKHHTDETKEKISKTSKGRKLSDETKRKIGEARIGKKMSEESKKKISEANKGKKHSEESKKHFSEAQIKRVKEGRNILWKHGLCYTKEYRKMIKHKYREVFKRAGELTVQTIQLVYDDNIKKYGALTCYLCENLIPFGKEELEHKIPLSCSGTNEYNNLAIACKNCNSGKRNKTEEEYRKYKHDIERLRIVREKNDTYIEQNWN